MMKLRIAMFAWLEYPHWSHTARTESEGDGTSFRRLTEYVEVEFPDLPTDEQVRAHVGTLRNKRAEVVDDFTRKLSRIDEQLSELLSLPAPEQPQPSDSRSLDERPTAG